MRLIVLKSILIGDTFVLATPISGPALMWQPHILSLDIELPTVETTEIKYSQLSLRPIPAGPVLTVWT